MENITNVQIVQLDAKTPIINSGHPTSWASALKQWSLKREWGKLSEMVGIWMEMVTNNGPKMTFNRHRTHACLPERLCLERLQLTLPQKWASSVTTLKYCSVARPGWLGQVAMMADMLQYQQWDEYIQEITWHKPVIVTTTDDNDVEDLMNVDGPITESTPSVEMLPQSVPQDRPRLSHLNKEQCRAHNIIKNHLLAHLNGRKPPQLLMLVLGQGGTGKSTLIRAITKTFDEWKVSQLLCKTATTGVMASLISRTTLHSWGCIPTKNPSNDDWTQRSSQNTARI
jgi:hypothetical protein